ncbi:sodium-coupled monocarboxylate transporter 1-like [Neocloeon triangulifer]|uniref:sodium-coupled monocarboxylate transporter 1-like n=1 Tax=Neocloeon triangulifer TaxID=2078957 RepID=UPI00286FA061|nr:sodium-coupled monocarboxylate transporter 1-like [Neocloeon triangulifer]
MSDPVLNLAAPPSLGWIDLGMFALMLAMSAFIGVYFGLSKKQDTAKEYLMGGKSMGMLPVSISLIASFVSGITLLGVPAEMYQHGTQYSAAAISFVLIGWTTATIFLPIYSKLGISSSYEYLELRFNKKVRRLCSVMYAIALMFYIPVVIYVPALAFSQVTGINVHVVTPITCLVCIFYTTLGGLRAVVWTDALQTLIMMAAIIFVMTLGAEKLGGWGRVWQINEAGDRLRFFNMDPDPFRRQSFWSVVVGVYFMFLADCATGQSFVQRYLSVPDLKTATKTVVIFAIGLVGTLLLSVANGLLVYASYADCDPIISQRASKPDQLLPLFVMDVAGHIPGFTGLFIAGVFSAALSSMSTGLNSLAGVLVQDLFAGYLSPRISTGTWLKTMAALLGFISVGLVYVVENLGGVLQSILSLNGVTSGPMLGLFVLGMFFPSANSKGALAGSLISLFAVGFVVFGAQFAQHTGALVHKALPVSVENCTYAAGNFSLGQQHHRDDIFEEDNDDVWPILKLSFTYYTLLGLVIVLVVGNLVSILCKEADSKSKPINRDLFCPLVHRFLPPDSEQEASPAEKEELMPTLQR